MSDYLPAAGDVFACWGADWVSRAISAETSALSFAFAPRGLRWSPSHVAIACPGYSEPFRQLWVESTTLTARPCLLAGQRVSGVQVHRIGERLSEYCERGRVDVYRLTPINALTAAEVENMRGDLLGWFCAERVRYSLSGAVFSGATVARAVDKLAGVAIPGAESVFCSQLIAAELQSLCRMNRENPLRFNPGRLLRVLVRQGVYFRLRSFSGEIGAAASL